MRTVQFSSLKFSYLSHLSVQTLAQGVFINIMQDAPSLPLHSCRLEPCKTHKPIHESEPEPLRFGGQMKPSHQSCTPASRRVSPSLLSRSFLARVGRGSSAALFFFTLLLDSSESVLSSWFFMFPPIRSRTRHNRNDLTRR